MCRKSTSVIVLVCLLALSNYALGAQCNWNAGGAANDWFDPANWNSGAGPVPTVGDRACIEAKAPNPVLTADACCLSLEINPWMWEYGPADCNFTINAGHFDCNVILIGGSSLQYAGPGWTDTPGLLTVNGGLVTVHNEVNEYPNEDAPSGAARGIWIGGGSTSWWMNYSNMVVNGGTVMTPKIAIYNGDLTINGGLVYDTCEATSQFIIRDTWARNKIYINGGTLGLKGDRRNELNAHITASRIVSPRGAFVGPTYNASALPEPNTTLSSDVNLGIAWQPSPAKYAGSTGNLLEGPVHFKDGLTLSWKAGDWIGEPNINEPNNGHYVFLGTDQAAVTNAGVGPAGTTATTVYRGKVNQPADDVNGDPNIFLAESNFADRKDYYWRVDEVNDFNELGKDPCNIKGLIWQFKTVSSKASNPSPADVVGGLKMPLQLTWTAGDWSPTTHWVYFGMSKSDVDNATPSSGKPIYRGTVNSPVYPLSKLLESPGYTLAPNTTYYWRVDEADFLGRIPGDSGWSGLGPTWSFNTGSSVSIDDFQGYFDTEELNDVWLENLPTTRCYPPYTYLPMGRVALVREGQSGRYMQFTYINKSATDEYLKFSEVCYDYTDANFTCGEVLDSAPKLLEIGYRGLAVNSNDEIYDRMYVAVEDTGGDVNIILNPDPNAQQKGNWTTWAISYDEMDREPVSDDQVDFNHVSALYLGFGKRCSNVEGGEGNVMFDNIRVLSSTCVTVDKDGDGQPENPVADFDGNCIVDERDLDILANDWLAMDVDHDWVDTKETPEEPILWYNFNETSGSTCADSATGDANAYTGDVLNYNASLTWDTDGGRGANNGCIYLPPGQNTNVEIITGGRNPLYFQGTTTGMSFSIWENADMTASWSWAVIFGTWNTTTETLEIHCPQPFTGADAQWGPQTNFIKRAPGDGATASSGKRVFGDFGGRWNNWIFVKLDVPDVNGQHLLLYLNGTRVADTNSTTDADVAGPLMLPPINNFKVGIRGGNWGAWMGRLDDFKVWNYALNEDEVHYIATDGTGILYVDVASVANINTSMTYDGKQIVNFGDLAMMVDEWLLPPKLWPPE